MTDFQVTIPEAFEASTTGALQGFESRCSCGLRMRNALRVSLELDARQHIAYHEAQASRSLRMRNALRVSLELDAQASRKGRKGRGLLLPQLRP